MKKKQENKDTTDPEEIDYQIYLQQPYPQAIRDKKREEQELQEAQQQLQNQKDRKSVV